MTQFCSVCYTRGMIIRDERREVAIERMADHLLKVGLAAASLRTLAKAAGTSDRMLLYYFDDKDELLAATLTRIAQRMTLAFDRALPAGTKLPRDELLAALWSGVSQPALSPYMKLWLDVAAGASRGDAASLRTAGAIVDGFLRWVEDHLKCARDEDKEQTAALLLATVDGLMLLNAVGKSAVANKAIKRKR